jgi:hypothetical protein
VLSAYDTDTGAVLAQVAVAAKSNEIPARGGQLMVTVKANQPWNRDVPRRDPALPTRLRPGGADRQGFIHGE